MKTSRREQILDAATELFHKSGYNGVGIDEVGQALGVTGPAIYHHFPNKGALLVAIFNRVLDRIEADSDAVLQETPSVEVLQRLMRVSAEFAMDEQALATVYIKDVASLPDDEKGPIVRRQRKQIERGTAFLRALKPELTEEQARTRWIAVAQGLIASIGLFHSRLDREDLADQLVKMSMAALLA